MEATASDDSGGVIVAPVEGFDDIDETSQIPAAYPPHSSRKSGWLFWVLPLLILLALIWALLRIFGGDDGDEGVVGTTVDGQSLPSLVPGISAPVGSAGESGDTSVAQPASSPAPSVPGETAPAVSATGSTVAPDGSAATSLAPPAAVTTAASTPVAPGGELVVATVKATCTAKASTDADGKPVDFEAPNLLDFATESAWRCAGKGIGESITFGFAGPTRVAQVGVTPGWVHIDPSHKDDRYAQNRRLRAVRWECLDAAGTVLGGLDQTIADDRQMQSLATGDFTACVAVRLTVKDVTNYRSRNFIAVSDVSLKGA
jgi:hypothetical protein